MTFKSDIYTSWAINYLKEKNKEHFICISLDTQQTALSKQIIEVGHDHHLNLDLRKLFLTPLQIQATFIFIAHNHPSGVVYPSQADIKTTLKIKTLGRMLNITLLDHLIVSNSHVYSFLENGII